MDVVDSDSGPGGSPSSTVVGQGYPVEDEDDMDSIFGTSASDRPLPRSPTFKQYGEVIKQLKHENFQLKVRIYLHETKGNKNNPADGVPDPNGNAATTELAREFHSMKQANDMYQMKIIEAQNQHRKQEAIISDFSQREELLLSRNQALTEQLDILDRELALSRLNQRSDSDDVEKCFNAFNMGGDEESLYAPSKTSIFSEDESRQLQELNIQNEKQIQELSYQIEDLKQELYAVTPEINERSEQISRLETVLNDKNDLLIQNDLEITKLNEKLTKLKEKLSTQVEALKAIGIRNSNLVTVNANLVKDLEVLEVRYAAQTARIVQLESQASAAVRNIEKIDSVKAISDLLRKRVTELIGFLEALLEIESRKLPVLPRVLRMHRESIDASLKQSQLLSETLGKILTDDLVKADIPLLDLDAFNAATQALLHLNEYECQSPRTYSRPTTESYVQCDMMREREAAMASTARINLLSKENDRLTHSKTRLVDEKAALCAQVATFKAKLDAMRQLSGPLQITDLKRQLEQKDISIVTLEKSVHKRDRKIKDLFMERNALMERLNASEATLRELHQEHGKLVVELKGLQSVYPLKENYEKLMSLSNQDLRRTDSSPDLGIESGHDGPSSENVLKANNHGAGTCGNSEHNSLKHINKELATKLKQTRHALDKTMERLNRTTKEKEQVEKAICRQLHKTHTILRQAKRGLETPGEPAECDLQLPTC